MPKSKGNALLNQQALLHEMIRT